MKRSIITLLTGTIFIAGLFGVALADSARDYISIVGSSTVYPFATVVAENSEKPADLKPQKLNPPEQGADLNFSAPASALNFRI